MTIGDVTASIAKQCVDPSVAKVESSESSRFTISFKSNLAYFQSNLAGYKWQHASKAVQVHDARSYYYYNFCNNNNLHVNVHLAKRDIFTADIYCYVTTEFDYAWINYGLRET